MSTETEFAFTLARTAPLPAGGDAAAAWGMTVDPASGTVTAVAPGSPAAVLLPPCRVSRIGQTVVTGEFKKLLRTIDECGGAAAPQLQICVLSAHAQPYGVAIGSNLGAAQPVAAGMPPPTNPGYAAQPAGPGYGGGAPGYAPQSPYGGPAPYAGSPATGVIVPHPDGQGVVRVFDYPTAGAYRCAAVTIMVMYAIAMLFIVITLANLKSQDTFSSMWALAFIVVNSAWIVWCARTLCCQRGDCCCGTTAEAEFELVTRRNSYMCVANTHCGLLVGAVALLILEIILWSRTLDENARSNSVPVWPLVLLLLMLIPIIGVYVLRIFMHTLTCCLQDESPYDPANVHVGHRRGAGIAVAYA